MGYITHYSNKICYYKNSIYALVVYDITERNGFNNIISWIEDFQTYSP